MGGICSNSETTSSSTNFFQKHFSQFPSPSKSFHHIDAFQFVMFVISGIELLAWQNFLKVIVGTEQRQCCRLKLQDQMDCCAIIVRKQIAEIFSPDVRFCSSTFHKTVVLACTKLNVHGAHDFWVPTIRWHLILCKLWGVLYKVHQQKLTEKTVCEKNNACELARYHSRGTRELMRSELMKKWECEPERPS